MQFSDLPDLCSFRIFSHLPPHALLGPIPLVCRAWRCLAQEACRRTHSIALIVGDQASIPILVDKYMQAHRLGTTTGPRFTRIKTRGFLVKNLTQPYCENLVESFPNANSLEVIIGSSDQRPEPAPPLASLQILLEGWAPRLHRLGIWFQHPMEQIYSPSYRGSINDFFSRLNGLKSLRILTLFCGYWVPLPHFNLQILGQLEQLDLTLPCSEELFLQALLGQCPGPARITLSDAIDVVQAVDHFTATGQAEQIPVLAGKFPHLIIELSDILPVRCLGEHFRHLQSLELWYNRECQARIQELSGPLSQLSQLNTLKLVYIVLNLPESDSETQENPPIWYPLSSVRVLMLEVIAGFNSHSWLEKELNPAVLLPDLEYLYVNGDYLLSMCKVCSQARPQKAPDGKWTFSALFKSSPRKSIPSAFTPADCLRTILEPFSGCLQLKDKIITSKRLPNNINLAADWTWRSRDDTLHPWW